MLDNVMNEEQLRNKLWNLANQEFDSFKEIQLKESKETIFDGAYKIAIMSDFLDMCDPENSSLSLEQVKALIKEKYPVQTLYNFYMKTDAGGIDDLYEAVWYDLADLVSKNNDRNKQKNNTKLER